MLRGKPRNLVRHLLICMHYLPTILTLNMDYMLLILDIQLPNKTISCTESHTLKEAEV